MYIRKQGNTLSLVRTTYCNKRKRGVQRSAGSLPADSTSIPADIAERLTEEEFNQLAEYLKESQKLREQEEREELAQSAYLKIKAIREAVNDGAELYDVERVKAELSLLTRELEKGIKSNDESI